MLTNENYYDDTSHMSVSLFKVFLECEHKGLATYRKEYHRPDTTALLVGSYVDAWVEGTLDEFITNHPEIISSRGATKGQLKAEFKQANDMIDRIESDPVFMEYLQGEKQVILTGEIGGMKWKGKLDVLHNERIVDFKTARSTERVMGKTMIDHWGYDIQGAVYQKLEGTGKPFYDAIVTKETPVNLEIVHINQQNLNVAMELVLKRLPRIKKIINGEVEPMRCNCCDYCRETKKITKPIDSDLLGLSEQEIKIIEGEI